MSLLASSMSSQLPNNSKVSRIQLKQKGTRSSNDDTNLVRKLAVQILQGEFDVWEMFGESIIPLIGDADSGVELHLAARYANYAGSGGVWNRS